MDESDIDVNKIELIYRKSNYFKGTELPNWWFKYKPGTEFDQFYEGGFCKYHVTHVDNVGIYGILIELEECDAADIKTQEDQKNY